MNVSNGVRGYDLEVGPWSGYELRVSDAISWRVVDARLSFDMGTRRAMDSGGHWVDLGVQVATGLVL